MATLGLTTQENIINVQAVEYVLSLSRTGGQGAQGYSAYQIAVQNGYTGTAQQFSDELTSITLKRDQAAASATAAANSAAASSVSAGAASASANSASDSATTATNQATASTTSATNSATSATQASVSAGNALNSATNAQASAASANTSQIAASGYEANSLAYRNAAQASATTATAQATIATNQATSATNSASAAATSATNSANSAFDSDGSADSALASATTATQQAVIASTQAGISTTKATEASASATSAFNSASTATNQAGTATTKAAEAVVSASIATTQAGIATTQANTATTQAGVATGAASTATAQATIATTKAAEAAQSAADAAAAKAGADASLASFRRTYLGELNADPTLDGNGSPVIVGAEYFNTVAQKLKVYTSTGWQFYDATAQTASQNAALSASQAASSAATSQSYASTAITKAAEADTSAQSAASSAASALSSKNASATSALNASSSETYALNYKNAAEASATSASSKAAEAATSATNAATSATSANTSATTATTQAGISTTQAGISTTQAGISTTQAGIATTKASEAATSATNAAASATSATASASTATTKASEASTSATSASGSASAASASASAASTSETNAGASATSASTSATNAASSASAASTSETNAATSATNSLNSANSSSTSATAANTSAVNAAASAVTATTQATNASTSAGTASTKATEAAASASDSAASAATATTKASEASTSATQSGTYATNSANSATQSATSATNSANSATASSASATQSALSASNASTSATNANTSATSAISAQAAAEAARDQALAAFDNFDDKYLGQKANDPTLDNDGNALVAGALYFNTTVQGMKVYTGSAWVAAYMSGAGYMLANNNLSELTNLVTARSNLGLGTSALANGYTLDELNDVVIANIADRQILEYEASTNTWKNKTINALPAQLSQTGKFLTTDGSSASWASITGLPSQTSYAGQYLKTDGTTASWAPFELPTSTFTRTSFTATAGQTTFSVTYPLGSIQVYVNGVLLSTTDYTATNGTSFTLGAAASLNDSVEAVVYNTYGVGQVLSTNIIGAVPITLGGTNATTAAGARTNLGLGTASTTDSTAYATAAQGTKADSALQTAAIGVSIQAYNANTVIDSAYVHTDNNYTSAEKSKVDTAYTDRLKWDGGSTGLVAATGRTSLELNNVENKSSATIRGELTSGNVTGALGYTPYNSTNPSGYTTNTGTVTSVAGTGTVSGLTLTGTVTTTGSLTLGGTLDLSAYNSAGAFSTLSASGTMTIGNGGGNGLLFINGQAASSRAILGQTAGTNRWIMYLGNPTAETGSDAGSNFQLFAVSDAGAGIDTPILITRASGGSIALGGTSNRPVTSTGNVGIGTTSINARLVVEGTQVNLDPNIYITQAIRSTAAYNASPRSGLSFAVKYDSNNNFVYGATIQGYKNNATNGDYGVGLLFTTQANGSTPTQSMTLGSDGVLLVGANSNTNSSKLVVNGTISQTVGSTQYLVVDQSDIGTGQNQIPLNQYLGSMAFQDKENVNFTGGTGALSSLDIAAISAQLNVSASSVFIYDTSKDSDGGAWRKRTQHASWYNEPLNTATRGARREFPAVAVIVANFSSPQLIIYDGDSPDMPLWISYKYLSWDAPIRKVSAVNGILAGVIFGAPDYSGNGLVLLDFIKDRQSRNYIAGYYIFKNGFVNELLSTTRDNDAYLAIGSNIREYTLSSYNTYDLAMTVLPNAPIDTATGLPIPTIAVATASGVSVIRDNGTVSNLTWSGAAIKLSGFNSDNAFCAIYNNGNTIYNVKYKPPYNTQDTSENYYYNLAVAQGPSLPWNPTNEKPLWGRKNEYVIGTTGVLRYLGEGIDGVPATRTYNVQTSTYNSGYMVGDIKGAWLSDTTQETVVGIELITNGTFDSSTTGWSAYPGYTGTVLSVDTNRLKVFGGGAQQSFSTVIGKKYVLSYTLTAFNPGGVYLGTEPSGTGGFSYFSTGSQGSGTYIYTFTATSTTAYIGLFAWNAASEYAFYDNVSVRLADADRSANNKGLQVFGTITKTPVATGSDLVAYSGFTDSNYLHQDYTSTSDIGTGNFSVSGWFRTTNTESTYRGLFYKNTLGAPGGTGIQILMNPTHGVYGYIYGSITTADIASTEVLNDGAWHQVVFTSSNNNSHSIYIDGKLATAVNALVGSLTNTTAITAVGAYKMSNSNYSWRGDLALWRFSLSAPSADQVAKMYNDEKYLFQPNAKATLYGTSDAVTALAYDSDTQLLHVGTSSGRSVFDGLRRVDNTTTAVATAISAVDGLVVEN
jgi:hypothetical protein